MNYFISYRANGIHVNSKIDNDMLDEDDYDPPNLGRRRPLDAEWCDYITEEQAFYISGLADGSITTNEKKPRHHSPEEIVEMLAYYNILRDKGADKHTAFHYLGISEQTYWRWKKNYKNLVLSTTKSGDVNAEQVA